MRRTGLIGCLLATLAWPAVAAASDAQNRRRLELVAGELSNVERTMGALSADYAKRRGLIGAAEAQRRYEEGVFRYLIEDYENAALGFYTLVNSESLDNQDLARDSEWYLARCLFELGNYTSAIAAFESITDKRDHAFFEGAVMGLLEIYGLLDDHENFSDIYKRYVVSGVVPPSDMVRYTVGKSLYHQGENPRAKAMFLEVGQDDGYHARARYFLGAILAAEGDFPAALREFETVRELAGGDAIRDLNLMALGRIHYELGNYKEAAQNYQDVDGQSEYFADYLYELSWTYIKQEQWENAKSQVDVFLLGFPEHNHAVELRLLQGHLEMKQAEGSENMRSVHLASALGHYEGLVDDFGPYRDELREIESSRERTAAYFVRISESEDLEVTQEDDLPAFALKMLVDEETMGRAVDAHRELSRQRGDLQSSRDVAGSINDVLSVDDPTIGTFERGRAGLLRVRLDALNMLAALTELELSYLRDNAGDAAQADLDKLEAKWEVLRVRLTDVQGDSLKAQERTVARDALAEDYAELRQSSGELRKYASSAESADIPKRIDDLADRVMMIDARALATERQLDAAEDKEVEVMRDLLASQRGELRSIDREIGSTSAETETLAADITQAGIARLEDELNDTIMQADMGIVDVYWLQKTDTSDHISRLARDRGIRMQELDDRYSLIRQKLNEQDERSDEE